MRKLLLSLAAVAALAGFTGIGVQAAPALPGAVSTIEAPIVQVQMSERRMMRRGMQRRSMMRHHGIHRRSMMKRHRMMHGRPMMHRRMRSM